MNFAAWNYRRMLEKDGGPLNRISMREIPLWSGETAFEAYAYLGKSFRPEWLPQPELYGNPDGTGTARHRNQACHKAISEAIERWAFYSSVESDLTRVLGFDLEPTTSGMAAFPGVPLKFISPVAKNIALREAVERWSICAWWEGLLATKTVDASSFGWNIQSPSNEADFGCVEIEHPWKEKIDLVVLLIWSRSKINNSVAFGFACERNPSAAFMRARAEQVRSFAALSRTQDATQSGSGLRDTMEKRLAYFSTDAGFNQVLSKIANSKSPGVKNVPPYLVNQEIRGPWSKYATVWRCLFKMPSQEHLSSRTDYFMF